MKRTRAVLGRAFSILTTLSLFAGLAYGAYWVVSDPASPLPSHWNPTAPLIVDDPITPLTKLKLAKALADNQSCLSVLETADITTTVLPDLITSDVCHIKGRNTLRAVGDVMLRPVETRCETSLRIAMWAKHGLQPAAQRIYGSNLAQIDHFSSYNCRQIRSVTGNTGRMSTHATADAIDVSGFRLKDGQRISLLKGWNGSPQDQEFLRAARDTSCMWFETTLGPDYNSLHADHFHLQNTGWGSCR